MQRVSFEEARTIVARARRASFDRGTYMVAKYGLESHRYWLCFDGAQEYLEGGDHDFLPIGAPVPYVDKLTGELVELTQVEVGEYIDTFTEVGPWPKER